MNITCKAARIADVTNFEKSQIMLLLTRCFPHCGDVLKKRMWVCHQPDFHVMAKENGIIIGQIGVRLMTGKLNGKSVTFGAISEVAVAPHRRRRYLTHDMFDVVMTELSETYGVGGAILFGDPMYYESYGWEPQTFNFPDVAPTVYGMKIGTVPDTIYGGTW